MLQRLLTLTETADFLARNPYTAARVAATHAAFLLFSYEQFVDPSSIFIPIQFPGAIVGQGLQVEDANYGLVTIFPTPHEKLLYSGWSKPLGDIDKPPYVPPPHDQTALGDLLRAAKSVLIFAAIGFGVYLGLQFWSKQRG